MNDANTRIEKEKEYVSARLILNKGTKDNFDNIYGDIKLTQNNIKESQNSAEDVNIHLDDIMEKAVTVKAISSNFNRSAKEVEMMSIT